MAGRKCQIVNVSFYIVKKDYFYLCTWMTKLAGKKQNINPMWKLLNKDVDLGETNIFPGSCILGMHSTTMPNKQRYCGQLQNHVRIANFRGRRRETTIPSKIFVFLHGLMIWRVMQRNVWRDIVSKPTRRRNNSMH